MNAGEKRKINHQETIEPENRGVDLPLEYYRDGSELL